MESNLWTRSLGVLVALASFGCDVQDADLDLPNGQFGEEDTQGCDTIARTPLAMDEAAPNGTTPQDIVDMAVGSHSATLTWISSGGDTELALEVSGPRDAAWVEYGSEDDRALCVSRLEVTVDLTLTTADGALAEDITTALSLEEAGPVTWRRDLTAAEGTFRPEDHTTTTYERYWAWLDVTFDGQGISGSIEGQGQWSEDGEAGSDSGVGVTMFEIAWF